MRGIATAAALVLAVLGIAACGGGDDGDQATGPTTGVPVAGDSGNCKPDPDAEAERREKLKNGEISADEAAIDANTERRTCEIELNLFKNKERICSVEIAKALLEGRVSEEQAEEFRRLQEHVGC
jgi:hypothetical protein